MVTNDQTGKYFLVTVGGKTFQESTDDKLNEKKKSLIRSNPAETRLDLRVIIIF